MWRVERGRFRAKLFRTEFFKKAYFEMKSFATKYVAGYVLTGTMIVATGLATRSALATVVATFVGFFTYGSIVGVLTISAVEDLRRQTLSLVDGDLSREVSSPRSDEFGDLYEAVNRLRLSLRTRIDEAEESRGEARKAKEKAEELAARQKEKKQALSGHVDDLLDAMQRFADGDLSAQVHSRAEGDIGRLFEGFNRAVGGIRETISQVAEAVSTADATAERVSASVEQLSDGAQKQSSQAEGVAVAMEEMARTTESNSKRVTQTSDLARRNRQTALENGEVVLRAVGKIEEIGKIFGRSADHVEELRTASKKISRVVETVNEIAEQTNLLALNAAIEAARAGEEGEGFAVVAQEVQDLAGEATAATKEIANRIDRVQEQTRQVARSVEAGQKEASAGIELAEEAREAFEEIVDGTETISDQVEEIAAATEQQSSTSEGVSQNADSILAAAQQNAEATCNIAEAIEELRGASGDARRLITQFTLGDGAEVSKDGSPARKGRSSENKKNTLQDGRRQDERRQDGRLPPGSRAVEEQFSSKSETSSGEMKDGNVSP